MTSDPDCLDERRLSSLSQLGLDGGVHFHGIRAAPGANVQSATNRTDPL